jgi:hypothetical protein
MDEVMGTGDVIIGIFAALGVLVLIVVFVVVVKTVLLKKDEETD